ncbi:MAG: 5-formyltetrahydrofolate cyclo-ligase [Phycisphaerae bacterium]|nr:5-formyltetrahydrofolate cyclo-ligase [Phycisphaerae bacterium]
MDAQRDPDHASDARAIVEQKRALRARMRQAMAALPPVELQRQSAQAWGHILSSGLLPGRDRGAGSLDAAVGNGVGAGVLMAYAAMPGETDPRAACAWALASGVRLGIPRVSWESGLMEAAAVGDLDRDLVTGPQGLLEPVASAPIIDAAEIDLVIVPGLAFDRSGGRLGRGGGYFDRFLSRPGFRGRTIGFCSRAQVVEHVPREPTDVVLSFIATPDGLIVRGGPG